MFRQHRFLVLLLGSGLGLCRLLPITSNHDQSQERAYNRGTEKDEDDGDADRPLAMEEEVLEGVVLVDKGLCCRREIRCVLRQWGKKGGFEGETYHEKSPYRVVEEYDGRSHEHGEAD